VISFLAAVAVLAKPLFVVMALFMFVAAVDVSGACLLMSLAAVNDVAPIGAPLWLLLLLLLVAAHTVVGVSKCYANTAEIARCLITAPEQ
jgi:hypothetical protein